MKLSIILRFCLWFMGISVAFPSLSQTMLVTNGNTSSRIILKENNQISWTAANLLQTFIQKVTSCKLPVVISQTPRKGDILIGGQSSAEVTKDGFSIPAYTATSKLMVFCAAETAFLRAEGKLRGWNVGSKTAKAYYEDGINLSMEQYQVSATEYLKIDEAPVVSHESDAVQNATATITNTVSVMWDDSEADNVNGKNFQRVITQKWIANYPLGLEAWAEYRRTGYPELYPCIDNLSDCGVSSQRGMRRLSFPYTEAQNNKANYDLGVAELGGADNEATDLKWAKKN